MTTMITIDPKASRLAAFEAVMRALFPGITLDKFPWTVTHEDVRFSPIEDSKYPHGLGGVQLIIRYGSTVSNARKWHRVMVKDGEIDLDSLKSKFEALKAIASERDQGRKTRLEKECQEQATIKAIFVGVGIEYGDYGPADRSLTVYPQGDKFCVKAEFISEAQLRAMLKAWKEA